VVISIKQYSMITPKTTKTPNSINGNNIIDPYVLVDVDNPFYWALVRPVYLLQGEYVPADVVLFS
jgi:hypothetical protein